MAIISSISLSGGMGKTTTCYLLSVILGKLGHKTLLLDCDPQSSLTFYSGVEFEEDDPTLLEVINKTVSTSDAIYESQFENVWIIPSDDGLDNAQQYLATSGTGATILKKRLKSLKDDFDFIIIDSPPQRSQISLAVIGASDKIIIPFETTSKGANSVLKSLSLIETQIENDVFEGQILGLVPFFDAWFGLSQSTDSKQSIDTVKNILSEDIAEALSDIPVFPSARQSEQYKKAINQGKTPRDLKRPDLNYPFEYIIDMLTNSKNSYD